jgi:hypothetical protein
MNSGHLARLSLAASLLASHNLLQAAPETAQPTQSVTINEPLASVKFDTGIVKTYSIGLGSSAFHYQDDPANVSYFMTDRGPNIKCKNDIKEIKQDLCRKGKIFPVSSYAPRIYKLQFDKTGGDGHFYGSYKVVSMVELKNRDGKPLSGMPNGFKVTDKESGFDQHGKPIPSDNEGVDTEALVRLSDGSFWIGEEYAPSLMHVDAQGRLMQRIVPDTVDGDLSNAHYDVAGLLPKILRKRRLNRGIEGVALSPDEKSLYFIMQSPLANPDKATYAKSRNVRVFKVSLKDGEYAGLVGEYLYRFDLPETFGDTRTGAGDVKKNPDGSYRSVTSDKIKISEMTVLPSGELVVLERVSKTTKLYRIELDGATNLLGSKYDDEQTRPTLEEISEPRVVGIRPVQKSLVFNSMQDAPGLPRKVEGVASIGKDRLVLINDNNFVGSVTVRATVVDLKPQLTDLARNHP